MSEIEKYVRKQLQALRLERADYEEVIDEITNHLEMLVAEYCAEGLDRYTAHERAFSQFGSPRRLLKGIEQAKENGMRERSRRLWLPAFTVGFLAYASEWLIVGFIRHPRAVKVLGSYYPYYWNWLLLVAAIAALGAWWSRAVGGSVRERLIVALAPAEIMAAAIAVLLPWSVAVQVWMDHSLPHFVTHPMVLLVGVLWMLHCAVPALIGAAPFLFGDAGNKAEAMS
jgi:hypothetical protein